MANPALNRPTQTAFTPAVLRQDSPLLPHMYELELFEVSQERIDQAFTRLPAVP